MGLSSVEIIRDEARIRPWEIWHLQADCTKLRSAIGNFKVTPLEEAVSKTIASLRELDYLLE